MGYLPLFLDVTGQACVVIGGGAVAERKVRALIEAAAKVTVVSPSVTAALAEEVRRGTVQHVGRAYTYGDIQGFKLAFVATGEAGVAATASSEARELGVPVNVADMPGLSNFIAPSVVRRGGLQIAISTGGASPGLARALRRELEESFGAEYAVLVELLGAARRYLREREPDARRRATVLNRLAVSLELREYLKRGYHKDAEALLMQHLGVGLGQLGFDPSRLQARPSISASSADSEIVKESDNRRRKTKSPGILRRAQNDKVRFLQKRSE